MHLCMASSIRAMPEKEKPPAMRVDLYCYAWGLAKRRDLCKNIHMINFNGEGVKAWKDGS